MLDFQIDLLAIHNICIYTIYEYICVNVYVYIYIFIYFLIQLFRAQLINYHIFMRYVRIIIIIM